MSRYTALSGYLVKRVLLLIPLLFGVTLVTFFLVRIGGTDPAVLMAGPTATPEEIQSIDHQLGTDKPVPEQYVIYLQQLLHGDMGKSWATGHAVSQEMADRFPTTLELVFIGMLIAVMYGGGIGFLSGLQRDRPFDHVSRVLTLIGLSVPVFWVGILFIYVFFFRLGWAPAPLGQLPPTVAPPPHITGAVLIDALITGNLGYVPMAMAHLALPALTLGLVEGAAVAKQSRAQVVEVVDSDIVRFARACGLPRSQIRGLVLRNALPNIVTYIAIILVLMLGGSALVEVVFAWGGVGQFGLDSITRSDFAVVQAYVLILGILSAIIYLVADIIIINLDPRMKYG